MSVKINGVAIVFVDFETVDVVVVEEDAGEVGVVDLLVLLGDLGDVDGHGQVRHCAKREFKHCKLT